MEFRRHLNKTPYPRVRDIWAEYPNELMRLHRSLSPLTSARSWPNRGSANQTNSRRTRHRTTPNRRNAGGLTE